MDKTNIGNRFRIDDLFDTNGDDIHQMFPFFFWRSSLSFKEGLRTGTVNLNPMITQKFSRNLFLTFNQEKVFKYGNLCFADNSDLRDEFKTTFAAIDVINYTYAVLHSRNFRKEYLGFLKMAFPQLPYPDDTSIFWQLIRFGNELRRFHLFEFSAENHFNINFFREGNNIVKELYHRNGNLYINEEQYFENVPQKVLAFNVGGIKPIQEWWTSHKNRSLKKEEIFHFQTLMTTLLETTRIMGDIDKVMET